MSEALTEWHFGLIPSTWGDVVHERICQYKQRIAELPRYQQDIQVHPAAGCSDNVCRPNPYIPQQYGRHQHRQVFRRTVLLDLYNRAAAHICQYEGTAIICSAAWIWSHISDKFSQIAVCQRILQFLQPFQVCSIRRSGLSPSEKGPCRYGGQYPVGPGRLSPAGTFANGRFHMSRVCQRLPGFFYLIPVLSVLFRKSMILHRESIVLKIFRIHIDI